MSVNYSQWANTKSQSIIGISHKWSTDESDFKSDSVNTADEIEATLQEINSEEVKSLYPLIVCYSIILIVGLIGNAVVLLVYTLRYKRSPARVFILFLASIDFSICLIGLPYHIIDLTNPYTFTDALRCKILTFIISTLFYMSIFALIVIAIDRYQKICRPLSSFHMSYIGKKRSCLYATLAAVIFSWPNLILYGPSDMETNVENVTGHACFFATEYTDTNYPLAHTIVTLALCLLCTVFLIMAYACICHRIVTRYKGSVHHSHRKSVADDTTLTDEFVLKNLSHHVDKKYNKIGSTVNMKPWTSEPGLKSLLPQKLPKTYETNYNKTLNIYCSNSNGSLIANQAMSTTGDDQDCRCKHEPSCVANGRDETKPLVGKLHLHVRSNSDCSNEKVKATDKESRLPFTGQSETQHIANDKRTGGLGAIDERTAEFRNTSCAPRTPMLGSPIRRCSEIGSSNDHKEYRRQRSQSLILSNKQMLDVYSLGTSGLRVHQSSNTSVQHSSGSSGKAGAKSMFSKQHFKITKIMLTVTSVFILSYMPALVITIISTVYVDFWDNLSKQQTILCEFLLRFYLVNNVCNPFIYGFWDKRFNREVALTFRKLSRNFESLCRHK